MTRTEGGVVSLLKSLTYDEAQGVMQRLRRPYDSGNPWADPEWKGRDAANFEKEAADFCAKNPPKNGATSLYCRLSSGRSWSPSESDLKEIDCWGPPGEKMVVWPKPDDYDAIYNAARDQRRAELGLTA